MARDSKTPRKRKGISSRAVTILTLLIVCAICFAVFYYMRDVGAIFNQSVHINNHSPVKIVYKKNSPVLSMEGPSGFVLGTVTNDAARDLLGRDSPFASCDSDAVCSPWAKRSDNSELGISVSDELLSSMDATSRQMYDQAIDSDSQCAERRIYQFHGANIAPARIETVCLSPSNEAFVYELLSS